MNDPVRPAGGGYYELYLGAPERELLRTLGPQMMELLDSEDDVLERLFPVAYPEDNDRETEYRLLVRDELRESHQKALKVLEETADAERLDEDHLLAWMRAINDLRLVLGTRLKVTEEPVKRRLKRNDPRSADFAVYDYLTWLQGEIISALED